MLQKNVGKTDLKYEKLGMKCEKCIQGLVRAVIWADKLCYRPLVFLVKFFQY